VKRRLRLCPCDRKSGELAISQVGLFHQLRLGLRCLGLRLDGHSLRFDPVGYALRFREQVLKLLRFEVMALGHGLWNVVR
jgi:hypothetical protein